MVGKCWSRSALIDLNVKVHLHVEETTTMRALVDVFTFNVHVTLNYRSLTSLNKWGKFQKKTPVLSENPKKLFLSPLDKFISHYLPGNRLTFHQNTVHRVRSDCVDHRWVMSQCLRVTDCKHVKVKPVLASFHKQRKHSLNEQMLCDAEWSCDMCVVWLEGRAAEQRFKTES